MTLPIVETPLIGIARMASESERLLEKKQVSYFEIEAKTILNRCSNPEMPFYWTINPYRGCEFGCKYCYSRYTHEYMGMEDGNDFERRIYSKKEAGQILAGELSVPKLRNRPVAIGTATDPYQPAERRYFTTRSILETLAAQRDVALSITTKSDLVTRDIDLLKAIKGKGSVHVNMSITTVKPKLARLLEPRAVAPRKRLRAVERLAEQGIPVGVFIMPVIPGLTDDPADFEEIARQAKESGASYLAARPLFLMPSARKVFLPFIEEKFPKLAGHYQKLFQSSANLPKGYGQKIQNQVSLLRQKYGLKARPPAMLALPDEPQQAVFPFDGNVA